MCRGPGGGGYIRPLSPEHHLPVHLNPSGTGDVSGDGVAAGREVSTEMVVTGEGKIGGGYGG